MVVFSRLPRGEDAMEWSEDAKPDDIGAVAEAQSKHAVKE